MPVARQRSRSSRRERAVKAMTGKCPPTACSRSRIIWMIRPDLYYRLGVFTIHLPPLRERGDDLAMLVQLYPKRFSRELGREVREVSPEAMQRLRNYSWP